MFTSGLVVPVAAAMHVVVPWLHVEVVSVTTDLRCVVVEMRRVVIRRLTPAEARIVRLMVSMAPM